MLSPAANVPAGAIVEIVTVLAVVPVTVADVVVLLAIMPMRLFI